LLGPVLAATAGVTASQALSPQLPVVDLNIASLVWHMIHALTLLAVLVCFVSLSTVVTPTTAAAAAAAGG
jgi:hypothetical protein